ncbi:RdgB/HAM1 family non-canonical purine NTP pyrophosphatase [Alicyclobacillaceae bacterium I2511]|nr:RdgB/HAM1 family non-canonical purine NTP pyrophosphatase [Alicyclobacillaceae bacterium I2511]
MLYIASHNQHKIKEFEELFYNIGTPLQALPEEVMDAPEGDRSFIANAVEKALYYSRHVQGWILADDSGLCVDRLSGAPGVLSARYAGEPSNAFANNEKLLKDLALVPWEERTAKFVCVLALWDPAGRGWLAQGEVEGIITTAPIGENGFGYDPLFYLPSEGRTFGQMSAARKQSLSHRAVAVKQLLRMWGGVFL